MAAILSISRLLLSSPTSLSLSTATTSSLFPPAAAAAKSLSSKLSFTSLPLKHHRHHPKPLKFSTAKSTISASISVGDKLPDATFSYFDPSRELQTTTIFDLTKNKKAILFAVPGAFTPICSQKHLPGFVEKSKDLKAKGVNTIACISVNDAFVMRAWKENLKVNDEVLLLADGNGDFTRAIGAELNLSDQPVGLGVRSRRYALLAEDGVVMTMVTMEAAILVPRSLIGISLQLAGECQGSFIFDLYQDLIDRGG